MESLLLGRSILRIERECSDYMHARHCSPILGRSLIASPIGGSADHGSDSWNLYAYVVNSPVKWLDPDGLQIKCATSQDENGNPTLDCSEEIEVEDDEESIRIVVFERPAGEFVELSDSDRFLSKLPIDGTRYGQCVEQWSFSSVLPALFSAIPERVVPPFTAPRASDPLTSIPSAAAHQLFRFRQNRVPRRAARAPRSGERFASRFATPLVVFEGFWNYGTFIQCSFRA